MTGSSLSLLCRGIAGRLYTGSPRGSLRSPDRFRRTRHGRRPRDGEHAGLRPRPRHRALRAVRGGDRPTLRRGACGRRRGEADARPDARDDHRDPPAQGRRDRRLRRHRADAPPLHPEGAPEPLRPPARRRLRPVRRHRGRAAGRRGGDALGRRAAGVPDRGADGRRDRGGPADRGADREHDRRRRRRHHRGRRDLARRDRRLPEPPRRRRRDGRGGDQLRQARVQAADRPADRGGDQARGRLGVGDAGGGSGRGPRPRPGQRSAEDDHPLLRGGPARARGSRQPDRRRDQADARQDPARAVSGHHGPRDRPRRRRRAPRTGSTSGCATRPTCRCTSPNRR